MNDLETTLKNSTGLVPVTAAVHPLKVAREVKQAIPGTLVSEVVQETCPVEFIEGTVVTINGEDIPRSEWTTRRLREGELVTLRAAPQGDAGKIFFRIFQIFAVAIAFAFSPWLGLAVLGLTQALYRMLITPSHIGNDNPNANTFGISGIQNQELQYGVVPRVYGRTLITPPKGAHTYTTSTNTGDTYLFALFDLGPGPIAISDIKIGNTDITSFSNVEYETREGRNTDADLTLFTNDVTQTQLNVLQVQSTTFTQTTPANTSHIELDVTGPGGLFGLSSGGDLQNTTVSFTVQIWTTGGSPSMIQTKNFSMSGKTTSTITNSFIMDDVAAGQYDVKIVQTTAPLPAKQGTNKVYWTALRTWGPLSGPLLPQNHAKIAVKIKANEQLNGDLQNLNCIAQAYVQKWNGTTFVESLDTHPAWAFLDVLTGSASNRPLSTTRVDLTQLKLWADTYPDAEFNYVFSQRTTLWNALRTIAPAGRASPVIRDGLYGVMFDAVQSNPVQLFTARNVKDFKASKAFLEESHGMEIRYVSETMGWQQHSVYVYAAGITSATADPTKIAPVNLTGVTSDDWAWKLGSYFFASSVLRPTVYTFKTDLDHLVANPGDRVWVQHDVITAGIAAGRIKSITRNGSGQITAITLDEIIQGDGTSTYKGQLRSSDGTIYTNTVSVSTSAGNKTFTYGTPLVDTSHPIAVGDLAAISTTAVALLDAIVKTVVPKNDFQAEVTCFDYAPEVHNGDGEVPPVVVNDRIDQFVHQVPCNSMDITQLFSDEGSAQSLARGERSPRIHGVFVVIEDGIPAEKYELQWQVDGDIGWHAESDLPVTAREFFITIPMISVGTTYNIRLRGNLVRGGDPGPWTTASLTFSGFTVQPNAPTLTVTSIINGVKVGITGGGFDSVTEYRVYANTVNNFSTASLIGSSRTQPVTATGLTYGTPYLIWATTVNGNGVESLPGGPVAAVSLPTGINDLADDLATFQRFVGDTMRDVRDTISYINTAIDDINLGQHKDTSDLRTELRASMGSLTASYTDAINVAVGSTDSIVSRVTTLEAALTGYMGDSAVATAINANTTSISTLNGTVSSHTSSITALNSQVGNVYSSGLFRVTTSASPAGADARIALQVAASAGGSPYAAAIYLDAMSGGTSRITMVANQIFMTDGTNNHNPFFYSGGTLYIDNAVIANLATGNFSSGSVTTAIINTNAVTNSQVTHGGAAAISFTPSWTTLASLTVTTTGGNVLLSFTDYVTWSVNGPRGSYRLLRDGSTVVTLVGLGGGSCPDALLVAGSGLDTGLSAGSHTWDLQATYTAGNTPTSQGAYMIATELKR